MDKAEKNLMQELKGIVNDAGEHLNDEWKVLQLKLIANSKEMSEKCFEEMPNLKAIVHCGMAISKEKFEEDDGTNFVGPSLKDYHDITGEQSPGHCRMRPVVGIKKTDYVNEFFEDKMRIISMYDKLNYISLMVHVKYKESKEIVIMSQPNGIGFIKYQNGVEISSDYILFDDSHKTVTKAVGKKLSSKQLALFTDVAEAQVVPARMKELKPGLMELLIASIPEDSQFPWVDEDEEDN
jgi:hypothetical protein